MRAPGERPSSSSAGSEFDAHRQIHVGNQHRLACVVGLRRADPYLLPSVGAGTPDRRRCPGPRRDADPDSDFDLLVTVQSLQETDRKRVFEVAADLSLEYGTVLAVLVVPTNDFREDRYFYLYENIQKEGQVV